MAGDKGKRILIHLSSSSSSSSSSDDNNDIEDGSCSASSSLSSGEEWQSIDEEDDDFEQEDDASFDNGRHGAQDDDVDDDDESLSNRVIQFLQEKKDLHELSLKACKAYLRKHGLRVSGNKDACVQRVHEHWRIRDGKAEILHPRASFVINCKGDVCRGDIVLFTQKVYGSFDKVTRRGKPLGQRTVAGRVVKESYGAAKQQHTFTVEVLWSKGLKKLPPLFPLLVKGRNLYRLKTYRQPWKNEEARRKVLAEKYRRGAAARMKRAKRKKAGSTSKGQNSQRSSHPTRQSQLDYPRRGKSDDRDQRASPSRHSINKFDYQHRAGAQIIEATSFKPFPRHQLIFPEDRASEFQSYYNHYHQYPQLVVSHHRSTFQNEIPHHRSITVPAAQYDGFIRRPVLHHSYEISSPWISRADSSKDEMQCS